MQIQNQTGNKPKKWYATGVVAECLPNRQYRIIVDGSRRMTLRNRKFLRRIEPVCRRNSNHVAAKPIEIGENDNTMLQDTNVVNHPIESIIEQSPGSVTPRAPQQIQSNVQETTPLIPQAASQIPRRRILQEKDTSPTEEVDNVRRGTRVRKARMPLSPKLWGKSHDNEDING